MNRFHLTQCINQMVLESQLPHKIVNLLFTIILLYTDDFAGELTFENHLINTLCQMRFET